MATACKFTAIWRFNLVWDSVDFIHKFCPGLWEKRVSVIRGGREDFVYGKVLLSAWASSVTELV